MSVATTRFPRALRLLQPARFQRVFKQNCCRSSDRYLTVLAVGNQLGHPCLGLAVSVKSSGNAVRRNRLKRLIRESFRQHQHQLGAYDLVVITRAGLLSLTNREITQRLAGHWQTINKQCAKLSSH